MNKATAERPMLFAIIGYSSLNDIHSSIVYHAVPAIPINPGNGACYFKHTAEFV